jgi:hypothetical protein
VEEDLRSMGVKRWKKRAMDRTEWDAIVKEARQNFKHHRAIERRSQHHMFLPDYGQVCTAAGHSVLLHLYVPHQLYSALTQACCDYDQPEFH